MIDQTVPVDKLRALLDGEGSAEDKIQAIYDDLLPPVLPDPIFLARATHRLYGHGAVVSHFPDGDGYVRFMFPDVESDDGTDYRWVSPYTLTFHTPETQETPDHPEFLTTEEDYWGAPVGTVVAIEVEEALKFTKVRDGYWEVYGVIDRYNIERYSDDAMSGEARQVLRWGF